jgi:pimeloyl-ACP methyl ester carboxylesterase
MRIEKQLLRIPRDHGVRLALLEKRAPALDPRLPPLLVVHGATFGHALFDLPRPGYSLLDAMASAGRVVYALDIRGYGASQGGAVMETPPSRNPPFARAEIAAEDIGAAVDLIRERRGVGAVDLVGFSWGTITAALHAGRSPESVARLVLYAPFYAHRNAAWLARIADPDDCMRLAPRYGAHRLVTRSDLARRWDEELPTDDTALFREDGIAELVFDALAALDPLSATRIPPALRCPNGALVDLLAVFNGRPLYDPAKLTMPTLLLRGADDVTATDADARRLLSGISSAAKKYRTISPGSHFLCIERNRARLYDELHAFCSPI